MERNLFRIRRNRILGGVCTGLGEYFGIDFVLIRIAFVVLGLFHGIGIILYIILWVVVPEKSEENHTTYNDPLNEESQKENGQKTTNFGSSENQNRLIAGISLIVIGLLFLADRLCPFFGIQELISIGLIIIGIIILWNGFKGEK